MIARYNYPLKALNTFGIAVRAKRYIRPASIKETMDLFAREKIYKNRLIILGGGSNLLFTGDFDGTVIQPSFDRIEIVKTDQESVTITAEAGLNWDNLVSWAVEKDLGGLENLSYIPGNVGAAPIQNIGAYGVEACELITGVHILSIENGNAGFLGRQECGFGYRDSIFKNELKGKYIITKVEFRLHRPPHSFNLSYENLDKIAVKNGEITLRGIRDAVIATRKEKLPDPAVLGNAGSFFKNPLIKKKKYAELMSVYGDMPAWQAGSGVYKISAAWLIEEAGWKGKSIGRAGVYDKHALILVNLGNAEGAEILKLSKMIIEAVQEKFDITLNAEVNII